MASILLIGEERITLVVAPTTPTIKATTLLDIQIMYLSTPNVAYSAANSEINCRSTACKHIHWAPFPRFTFQPYRTER
jgi:hypothetical protein